MTIHYYSDVTVTLDGKPVGTADATAQDAPRRHEPLNFTTPVDADAVAEMFNVARLPPAQPRGYITIPYGILGPIQLRGIVDPLSWENVATGGFRIAGNELERAVSMAVQKAILTGYAGGANDVATRAWIDGETPKVREMGRALLGRAYRGERKRRKAMRRLLRAAGVIGEKR